MRDQQGHYLAPIGSRSVLKTRSPTVTKDELFSLEDSLPQASFVAASNARYVSVKQGKITIIHNTLTKFFGMNKGWQFIIYLFLFNKIIGSNL